MSEIGHPNLLPIFLAVWVMMLLPFGELLASDFRPLGDGEMIMKSTLIVEIDLSGPHGKPNVRIASVLKGKVPDGFVVPVSSYSIHVPDQERHYASFGNLAKLELDDLPASSRWILFFEPVHKGGLDTFHPACVKPVSRKERVLEILSMAENPAPFVSSPRYAGDLDLIHILGVRFHALRFSSPDCPELDKLFHEEGRREPIELPWQQIRFTMRFAFRPALKPKLQMTQCDAKGALPDYLRKMARFGEFDGWGEDEGIHFPAEFEIHVDTTGPEKIGDLRFAEAATFLREQLRTGKLEVVTEAYLALARLMDSQSVPIALQMLEHPDIQFQIKAAGFLSYAKDIRSIEPLCARLDQLPPISGRGEAVSLEIQPLISSIGETLRDLNDDRCVPTLKRTVIKGYVGGRIASALCRMGDESAFDALATHLRNPAVSHFPGDLEMLVERSNLPVEPWMIESRDTWSSDRDKQGITDKRWLEWWDAHKGEFKIVRTWEEACQRMRRE